MTKKAKAQRFPQVVFVVVTPNLAVFAFKGKRAADDAARRSGMGAEALAIPVRGGKLDG